MEKRGLDAVADKKELSTALNYFCDQKIGVLDSSFLCRSVGSLEPHKPLCARQSDSIESVVQLLQKNRLGCVVIVSDSGKVSGIFSERDYILKVFGNGVKQHDPISKVMTSEPITGAMDMTLAFALSLMSQGGFRHIPIVDQDNFPVGIISVKDVVDHIVALFMEDALSFKVEPA